MITLAKISLELRDVDNDAAHPFSLFFETNTGLGTAEVRMDRAQALSMRDALTRMLDAHKAGLE